MDAPSFSTFSLPAAIPIVSIAVLGSLSAPAEDAAPVEVTTAQRSEDVVRTFEITGTVNSRRRARLSSRTTGLVQQLEVDAGSRVETGDVLLALDPRLAEIDLELIRSEIEGAEVELADAKRRVEEVRELTESGGFARSEARTLEAAERIQAADLKTLRARETQQLERLERHRLVAPFSGVISAKLTEEGEWVDTGDPVLELVEIERLWFDVQVPQEFLAPIRDAEKVEVTLDAYPERPLEAAIDVVVPVKDAVSRTFLTRLELADPGNFAAPGMSGEASVSWRSTREGSIKVPRDAVVRFPDGSAKVWIVKKDGEDRIAYPRLIRTAGDLGEWVEVVDGLEGGESVVVRGNEGLREGQHVRILEMNLKTPSFAP